MTKRAIEEICAEIMDLGWLQLDADRRMPLPLLEGFSSRFVGPARELLQASPVEAATCIGELLLAHPVPACLVIRAIIDLPEEDATRCEKVEVLLRLIHHAPPISRVMEDLAAELSRWLPELDLPARSVLYHQLSPYLGKEGVPGGERLMVARKPDTHGSSGLQSQEGGQAPAEAALLPPANTPHGRQARLRYLDWPVQDAPGAWGPSSVACLMAYQIEQELSGLGIPSEETDEDLELAVIAKMYTSQEPL